MTELKHYGFLGMKWVLVDKRKANGERLADILDEFRIGGEKIL